MISIEGGVLSDTLVSHCVHPLVLVRVGVHGLVGGSEVHLSSFLDNLN